MCSTGPAFEGSTIGALPASMAGTGEPSRTTSAAAGASGRRPSRTRASGRSSASAAWTDASVAMKSTGMSSATTAASRSACHAPIDSNASDDTSSTYRDASKPNRCVVVCHDVASATSNDPPTDATGTAPPPAEMSRSVSATTTS